MPPNRFDALRLLFAATVFIYHLVFLATLTPQGPLEMGLASLAELAIQGFFIISGALVYGSFRRSHGLSDYAAKRMRRLYPAYAVIILIPAGLALIFNGDLKEVLTYLGANLTFANFLAPTLPGVFEGQRSAAVNGSLWTLKIEVMFYISLVFLVPILDQCRRWRPSFFWGALLAIYLGGEAWRIGFEMLASETGQPLFAMVARQLPGQMAYFVAGIALWDLHKHLVGRYLIITIGASLVLGLSIYLNLDVFRPAALAGLIASLALAPGPRVPAARWGDFSYGIYIVHFPIVQSIVATGLFVQAPFAGILTALLAVGLASSTLWHLVERPALRRDSHYRSKASTASTLSR